MKKLLPVLLLVLGLVLGFWLGRAAAPTPPVITEPSAPAEAPPSAATAPGAVLPAEVHTKHTPYGLPVGTPATNDLVVRDVYALSSNDATKFADWVAFRVDAETIEAEESTSRQWRPDPWLDDAETLEPGDYRGAYDALGVDRGHQAPLATLRGTGAWEETNYLSNITPQRSALNQGPWRLLEERVRDLIGAYEAAYVATGPLYERTMPSLPGADEGHRVPSGYWQVVLVEGEGGLRAAAFVMDQDTPRSAPVLDGLTTIDEVERRSGLDLFAALPDAAEAGLESAADRTWASAHFGD